MLRPTLLLALLAIAASAPTGSATSALAQSIDLTAYGALLAKDVNAQGMVAYAALKSADGAALDAFLAKCAAARPETFATGSERLAFWVNAYNASVLKGVVAHYPTDSVMSVPNFFKEQAYTIAGEKLSLDQIENQKIRPVFKDPRVHFALVCGAKSCPRLLNRAYTGVGLDAALDGQAHEFLADANKNRFEAQGPVARVSQIFNWYGPDFAGAAGSVAGYLKKYAPASALPLLGNPAISVQYMNYDWKLNAQ